MVEGLVEEKKIRSHLDHGNTAAVHQQLHGHFGGVATVTG
jgi:hypothetical protein